MKRDLDKDNKDSRVTSFAEDIRICIPSYLVGEEDTLKGDLLVICNWAGVYNMKFNNDNF